MMNLHRPFDSSQKQYLRTEGRLSMKACLIILIIYYLLVLIILVILLQIIILMFYLLLTFPHSFQAHRIAELMSLACSALETAL